MMRIQHVFIGIFAFFLLASSHLVQAEQNQSSQISWLTNYEEAIELAESTSKPILLFFTGSDWCGWCDKLEKEVFETADFMKETSGKLIFVKLDFPMHTPQDTATTKQNKELQNKFSVRSFPTVVLIDAEERPIGVTGYRAGDGKQYSYHLMKMVNEYTAYKQ
ncbi:MAG: thioredoxin family protein [Waddliaceae bacterium]